MRSGTPKPTSVHGLESCTPVLPLKGECTGTYTLASGAGGSACSGWSTARDLVTGGAVKISGDYRGVRPDGVPARHDRVLKSGVSQN